MKKFSLFLLISILAVFLMAGSAMAAPFNIRPITLGSYTGESTMQEILDIILDPSIDAYNDQHPAAIWEESEANVSSYRVVSITSVYGVLGIYSYADPSKTAILGFDSFGSTNFNINAAGALQYSGGTVAGFGESWGFFWDTGNNKFYTEDSLNGGQARSVSYLIEDGTKVDLTDTTLATIATGGNSNWVGGYNDTLTARSDNDWLVGFEDGTDNDFQDALFYFEDMDPVPEPATMFLFGLGIIGLVSLGRKKFFKK